MEIVRSCRNSKNYKKSLQFNFLILLLKRLSRGVIKMVERIEEEKIEEEEKEDDDRTHRLLSKAVVIQALYAIIEDKFDWKLLICVDDLSGFGRTVIFLPRDCLNKQRLQEFIDEVRNK
jgi:hypothetical protein